MSLPRGKAEKKTDHQWCKGPGSLSIELSNLGCTTKRSRNFGLSNSNTGPYLLHPDFKMEFPMNLYDNSNMKREI